MLKFENVAKVGEYIKAMDFRPREDVADSFVIGKVLRYAPARCGYYIECGFDTEGHRVGEEIFVPFGLAPFAEWDDRVQYVSEGAYKKIKCVGGL